MTKSADLFRASRVSEFPHSFDPAKPAQPAKPASQASQPARPARPAGHRSLRPPGIDVSNSFYRGSSPFLKGGTGRHRADNLLAPTAPGGAAKHATNPSNIDDMTNFPSNRVMGRPFHGCRVPIKILKGPGCHFHSWFIDLIAN